MVSQLFRKFQEAVKNGTPLQYVNGGSGNPRAAAYGRTASRQTTESSLSFIGDYLAGWRTIEVLLNGPNRHNPTVLMEHVESQRKIVGMNPLGLIRLQSWDDFFGQFRWPDHLSDRFESNMIQYGWNYVLLAYGVVAFLASFKAGGFFMNLLAIAQVLALAVPYHDSRNPAHDADLAYYSLWAFLVIHILLWYQFLTLLSSSPLYCSIIVVLITAHASLRTREWVRLVKDTIRKRNGQVQQQQQAAAAGGCDATDRQRRMYQRRPME
ncbi:hypothetical protein FOZ63_029087 [Perkinsus olseni]|uniref:PRA1 family protein n=1 Tax=Perkinsus olseni TaxID=32597 RepID=A0A7J6QCJ5_PEROL|nr:hypothetical protein FOZ63_029087 [Perkinsus olseni]